MDEDYIPNEKSTVIRATFSDWKTIKTRKQLQLIFEVPIEETEHVLEVLGAPMPHRETWCAIVALVAD